MCHHVTVDAVRLAVLTGVGTDGTADVAALMQEVIRLQRDGGLLLLKESVTDLCVPNEFVRVHVGRRVTATRTHADVGGESETILEVACRRKAIVEVECVLVVGSG